MKSHFDKGLNVKELILAAAPEYILELGCGGGDNTIKLAELAPVIAVDIGNPPDRIENSNRNGKFHIVWHIDVSYRFVDAMSQSVDFAIIDTDHNGWTLDRELRSLDRVCTEKSVICMHDTFAFRKSQGFHNGYNGIIDYPKAEMETGPTMTQALQDFMADKRWEIIRETDESNGATAITRKDA